MLDSKELNLWWETVANSFTEAGIYGNSGIRFRSRFISKCHVKANSIETPKYAVIIFRVLNVA
jgi:hypothetical protein